MGKRADGLLFDEPIRIPEGEAAEPPRPPHPKRLLWRVAALAVALLLAGDVLYLAAGVLWLPPEDLGVRVGPGDLSGFLQKADITLLADGNGGWDLEDVRDVSFAVTAGELTAFLAALPEETRPFSDAQVDFNADDHLVISAAVRPQALFVLLPEVRDQLAVPPDMLPEHFNFYAELDFSAYGGNIRLAPLKVRIGRLPFSMSDDDREAASELAAGYFGRLLERLGVTLGDAAIRDGELSLSGRFPSRILGRVEGTAFRPLRPHKRHAIMVTSPFCWEL